MATEAPNQYLKTKVMTAGPAELRLMLFDGAIKFAEQARIGLVQKDYEEVFNGITKCQSILIELMSGLKSEFDPDLTSKLSGLYTFLYTRLLDATQEKDPQIIDEVLKLLRYERETWSLLIEKLTSDTAAAADAMPTSSTDALPTDGRVSPVDPSTLVGGSLSLEG